MALHYEGASPDLWEDWSRRDPKRYHEGECRRKWESFTGGGASPVTGASLVKLAREGGWRPDDGAELDWDGVVAYDAPVASDAPSPFPPAPDAPEPFTLPDAWEPAGQLITYLETLFAPDEKVGYVTQSVAGEDGRLLPTKGHCDRTAAQLIDALRHCGGDVGAVVGDCDPACGAWIRINPLDGQGVRDGNVTAFRYALVESDSVDLATQHALIRALRLPVAALVYSGGKSLHAVVRVDAADADQYRERVERLYRVCDKNGLTVDRANRNPSRLSRMPGVVRKGSRQYLLATDIGAPSWEAWVRLTEPAPEPSDGLPPIRQEIIGQHGNLAPALIEGVLRQGHKMLLAGPSKAGKSFALLELAVCIAEGLPWLGFPCAQGKVLYVNLELDEESCKERLAQVREALHAPNRHAVDLWHLRGRSLPLDALAPILIERASSGGYIAVIIDPIYKIITGDENAADQMARFCHHFDAICTSLGCAVIYCHHHSKGLQGQKRSMDRASGSGVFARDPDAMLDLIELERSEELLRQERSRAVSQVCMAWLERFGLSEGVSHRDALSGDTMMQRCRELLPSDAFDALTAAVEAAEETVRRRTAWRVDGTLREFPKFAPVDIWFDYPIHRPDAQGVLSDLQAETERPFWQRGVTVHRQQAAKKQQKKRNAFEEAFRQLEQDGTPVPAAALAEALGVTSRTLCTWMGEGCRANKNLKEEFELFTGDDCKRFVRRVQQN